MSPKGGWLASERGRSWPRRERTKERFLPHLIALFERLARGSHGKSHRYPLSASMSLPSCYITLRFRLTHYLSETQSCVKPQPMRGSLSGRWPRRKDDSMKRHTIAHLSLSRRGHTSGQALALGFSAGGVCRLWPLAADRSRRSRPAYPARFAAPRIVDVGRRCRSEAHTPAGKPRLSITLIASPVPAPPSGIDHDVAHEKTRSAGTLPCQVLHSTRPRRRKDVAGGIGEPAVDLLRHVVVEATQPRLDVNDTGACGRL